MNSLYDIKVLSVMALFGMDYLQAYRHAKQRTDLGYAEISVLGKKVQKRGGFTGNPKFNNGNFEEVIAGVEYNDERLVLVFANGEKIDCTKCTFIV